MSRAPKGINELYYARDNNPSFYQFKKAYHFVDAEDRQYMIAEKNRQVFQNARFKDGGRPRRASDATGIRQPVISNYGFAKLYVKLLDPESKWFGHRDIGKPLFLTEKTTGQEYIVILKSTEKHNMSRRTGTIQVKGLLKEDLLRLLNS